MNQGLDFEWCAKTQDGLPKPDIIFWMQLNLDQAEGRCNFGEEKYEKREFLLKVTENFDR